MSKRIAGPAVFALVLLFAPALARSETLEERHEIVITANRAFDEAHGVRAGSGTPDDPFVISGWDVHHVTLLNTTKAVRIVGNSIGNLVLNYAGSNVTVTGNDIGDLRVNENVRRRMPPTGGLIARNRIDSVSQIRHFDGRFVRNVVGSPSSTTSWPYLRAVNFDGFNGAVFAHNTIYGFVEARLHGHHHGSGFGQPSHMHAASTHHDHDGMATDHSKRWHEVTIAHNTITSDYRHGLLYTDTNHAANDRTATSETNEALNAPHVHRTRVTIADNTLFGGGIGIDVFNALDDKHRRYARGTMTIERNTIELRDGWFWPFEGLTGIDVYDARSMNLHLVDNTVMGPPPRTSSGAVRMFEANGAGVRLWGIDRAHVMIDGLRVSDRRSGVDATQMSDSVHWMISGLQTDGVDEDITYDHNSVANEPERH